jgi:hypothetical protein
MPKKGKREKKKVNTSEKREQKIHVSISHTASVPNVYYTQSDMSNSSNSSFCNSIMNEQHSTPVNAPLMRFQNSFQGNQFTPYAPQGPQSQFAGYVSPISS